MKRLITLILLACTLCLQAQVKMMKGANDPIGTPKGIHAGRVAWTHAPGATRWPGEGSDNWYDDQWNDQEASDWLVRR